MHCREQDCLCKTKEEDFTLLYSRFLYSITKNRSEVWLTLSAQPQVTINTATFCVAI